MRPSSVQQQLWSEHMHSVIIIVIGPSLSYHDWIWGSQEDPSKMVIKMPSHVRDSLFVEFEYEMCVPVSKEGFSIVGKCI